MELGEFKRGREPVYVNQAILRWLFNDYVPLGKGSEVGGYFLGKRVKDRAGNGYTTLIDFIPSVERLADSWSKPLFHADRGLDAAAAERGLQLVAIFHSHPEGFPPCPSADDWLVMRTTERSFLHVIYSPDKNQIGIYNCQGDNVENDANIGGIRYFTFFPKEEPVSEWQLADYHTGENLSFRERGKPVIKAREVDVTPVLQISSEEIASGNEPLAGTELREPAEVMSLIKIIEGGELEKQIRLPRLRDRFGLFLKGLARKISQ